MTKKDFIVIADIIADIAMNDLIHQYHAVKASREYINKALKATNPNYSEQKFWDYVGMITRDYEMKIEDMDR